jgi:hypothetical protein
MGFATIGKVQEKVGSDEILCPRGKQILQKKLPLTSIFPKLVQKVLGVKFIASLGCLKLRFVLFYIFYSINLKFNYGILNFC